MKNENSLNRLGICIIYDKHGVVDESVMYLLHEMRTVLSHLVIVCNGFIDQSGIQNLKKYGDRVYMRENSGYDVAAYKCVLEGYIGWEHMDEYDELVLFNTTFFGFFSSVKRIFNEMNAKHKDFWGITRHGAMRIGDYQVPCHIQSYFLVISDRLFHSEEFKEFWTSRKDGLEDITEVIDQFELTFTRTFEERGYSWGTYVDTSDLEGADIENNFNPLVYLPCTLLRNYGLPLLKKRLWPWTHAERGLGDELLGAINYIERCTDYDINIIWNYMIRCLDINELREALHLHFVISHHISEEMHKSSIKARPAVIVCMHKESHTAAFIKEHGWLSETCDLYYVTPDETGRIGREALAMASKISDGYQYICFFHQVLVGGNKTPQQLAINHDWCENLLKSDDYVNNIQKLFDKNRYLGVLCPPMPYHSDYLSKKSHEWYYEYEEIEKLTHELNLICKISEGSESPVTDFAFWFRAEALRKLLLAENFVKLYYESNPMADDILPRIIPYIAQHEGYYTAIAESSDFAGMHLEGIGHLVSMHDLHGGRDEKRKELLKFCRIHKQLYIYGAGKVGKGAESFLVRHGIKFKGFVVSDDRWDENLEKGVSRPIYPLSQVGMTADTGILVALNAKNAAAALKELDKVRSANNLIYCMKGNDR